jgi:hypothetical protein
MLGFVHWMRLNVGAPGERAPHAEGKFKTPSGKCDIRLHRRVPLVVVAGLLATWTRWSMLCISKT